MSYVAAGYSGEAKRKCAPWREVAFAENGADRSLWPFVLLWPCVLFCPALNSHHITPDFITFSVRDVFSHYFSCYRTVCLSSALNFRGGVLRNWHL